MNEKEIGEEQRGRGVTMLNRGEGDGESVVRRRMRRRENSQDVGEMLARGGKKSKREASEDENGTGGLGERGGETKRH